MAGTLTADGVKYEFHMDFDIGEARTIYRYSNLTLDQLDGQHANPNVIAAFLHIAMKRQHPEASDTAIEELVNKVKLATIEWDDDEAADASPPTLGSDGNEQSSGVTGKSSSGHSQDPSSPAPTGHPPLEVSVT